MATPGRDLILDNIVTVLGTITVAAGYKTTVTTVARGFRDWAEMGASELPAIQVWPGRCRYKEGYLPFSQIRAVLEVRILAHVTAATLTAKQDALAAIEDDIIAALSLDTKRGGSAAEPNAISTTVVESGTDEGDDSVNSEGGTGSIGMLVEVVFMRSTAST